MAFKQKSYRKFVATAATATLVASAVAPFASAASADPFKDVASKYKDAVNFLLEKDATKGMTETQFGVNENIKRVDAAVQLVKVLGLDTEKAPASGFTDVPSRAVKEVNALKAAGITSGKTETTFNSDALITRGELAVWIQRAFELKGTADVAFTDVNKNYTDAVSALVTFGITNGINKAQFGTDNNAKRGDFAIFLMKAAASKVVDKEAPKLKYDGEKSFTVENGAAFTAPTVTATDNVDKEVKVTSVITDAAGKEVSAIDTKVAGVYTITYSAVDAAGNKAESVAVKVTVKEGTPAVVSVSAINTTQVEVKFNQAVNPASLFIDGKSGAFKASTVSLKTLDGVATGNLKGTLSADSKTLTITAANSLSKRYDIVVDNVKTINNADVAKHEEMITIAADKTAPTIVSTTKVTSTQVKVTFSEPIKSLGNVTYKLADGTVVTDKDVTNDFTAGAQEVTFTLGGNIKANAEVMATFIGAQDQAGNLLAPNPATVSLVKGDVDGVAPTVASITQLGASKFVVKFSEQLQADPAVTINGKAVSKVEKDANDATQYIVTTSSALNGAATVVVSNFTDLSGEKGKETSKVVSFVKDTAASKVVSSAVVADETTKKEYLELTFDKDVVLGSKATVNGAGSYLKDYVTTSIGAGNLQGAVSYKSEDNKKVVRVELDAFLGTTFDIEGAAYTLTLSFAGVTSEAGVNLEGTKVTFNRSKDGVSANNAVVGVTSVAQETDNNKVAVTFDKAVDGATATNVANYAIDGAVVESVTLQPVKADGTQVAVLNLKAGSNQFTGVRNYTIKNIKALGSTKVMEEKASTVSLKENVAPTVVSATLTATNKVKLTFSEAVSDTTGLDFEVLVGGKSQAAVEKVSLGATSADTTATLTINAVNADELAKGISLKGLDTLDIVDAAGNKLSVPTNISVTQ